LPLGEWLLHGGTEFILTLHCSKRNVQDQLSDLLQHQPNTIRGRTVLPKGRLRLVRECRALRPVNESHSPQLPKETRRFSASCQEEKVALTEHTQPKFEWPWQVDQVLDSYGFGLVGQQKTVPAFNGYCQSANEWPCQVDQVLDPYGFGLVGQQKDQGVERFNFTDSKRREGIYFNTSKHLPIAESDNSCLVPMKQGTGVQGESALSITDNPSVESDRDFSCSSMSLSPVLEHQVLHQQEPNVERTDIPEKDPGDSSWIQSTSSISPAVSKVSTSRRNSCQSSIHSIGGLQARLPLKTDSCLEDVWSVMQNLTISGSSMYRDSASARKSSVTSTSTLTRSKRGFSSLEDIDENEQHGPWRPYSERRLLLPGDFAGGDITAPRFDHNDTVGLRRIADSKYLNDRLALLDYRFDQAKFVLDVDLRLYGEPYKDVDDSDDFGNSVLHVSTALRKPPAYLFGLIDMMTDIHSTNRAGQTFLHLLDQSLVKDTDPFHTLLSILHSKSFDFNQRDCLGRTPLHLIMQPWMDKSCLEHTLAQLSFLRVIVPTSRDSFGRTIMSQLKEAGISEERIQYLYALKQKIPVLPNYGARTAIETVADLLIYEQQASLLRTIRRAWSHPQEEDHAGRNGLHCLAEVSFTLPLPDTPPADSKQAVNSRRREELRALLKAGVDVNNYDKQGVTPLMSFIIHNRDDEDNVAFHTLLDLLCNAGADVHRRDRQGRSPLHLAVSLGKTIATHFLLRQGANIHARDIDGLGVIALGLKQSKLAKRSRTLYGQIMLCVSLVADSGGVAAPTFLYEWTSKENIQETKESRWALRPRRSIRKRDIP
jgi:hypothetical protein